MKYIDFYNIFKNKVVFSTNDIRKFVPGIHEARLTEWVQKGYLTKVSRGWYTFPDLQKKRGVVFFMANKIYEPSYISLETALSFYHLIPERVYATTSVSTKKIQSFDAGFARFSYKQISPKLNWGYGIVEMDGFKIKIASIEKTVLDYLYLHRDIVEPGGFHEWRFNREEFLEQASLKKMREYAKRYQKKWFLKKTEELILLIKNGSGIKITY